MTKGDKYRLGLMEVMALEDGEFVAVREIRPQDPGGLGPKFHVSARALEPLPMKYYGGQIP